MTPLKQQISLIPFSIEHTGIAITSDLANYRCSVWVQTSANAKIRNKSDPGFVFGLIWIQMSVKIMDTLVGVIHFAKLGSNRLLIHLIVWKLRKQRNANKCRKIAYPQWWRKWTRGQSNLTKSASRGAHSPVRGDPRGSKVVPLNSWGRVSY